MSGGIPSLPQYAYMAWCLVKHKENFTFLIREHIIQHMHLHKRPLYLVFLCFQDSSCNKALNIIVRHVGQDVQLTAVHIWARFCGSEDEGPYRQFTVSNSY
jgi:hypothetical protein